jgi:glutathione S-transferase
LKLFNSLGPNPRLVRIFLHEKGVELPTTEIDIMAGENRREPYLGRNPGGQLPALELDDGTVVAETIPICEWIEERHPTPALIGSTPDERAVARMWTRRVEWWVIQPLTDGFRFAEGQAMFKDRLHLIPHAADDLKQIAQEGLAKLDGLMGDGRTFLAGDRFTLADVTLYAFLDFGAGVGQPTDPKLERIAGWFERVSARPSAEASLHPVAKAGGMRA